MRILMIACVPFYEERGTPLSIYERLKALSEFCENVDVVTYHIGKDVNLKNITIVRIPDLKLIKQVPVGPSVSKLILDLILSFQVLYLLIRKDYDLIYSNEEGVIFGAYYSRIFKIPHLYDFHSSLPDVLDNFGRKRYMIFKEVFKQIERFAINQSKAVITISPLLTEYVKTINNEIPVVTIENTKNQVCTDKVRDEDVLKMKQFYSISENTRVILYTGTFESYQGLDLLLMSAQLVNREYNNITFILVGGDDKQVDYYRKKSLDLGIQDNIFLPGKKPQEDLAIYYSITDALVSPRTRGLNPPLKIYQYMSLGIPIIATNIAAHTQILNSGIACLAEPVPSDYSDAIIRVLSDKTYAGSIASAAKNHYKDKYANNTNVDDMKKIIDEVIN